MGEVARPVLPRRVESWRRCASVRHARMTSAKIAIANLSHRFTIDGREVLALDDVTLDVTEGE